MGRVVEVKQGYLIVESGRMRKLLADAAYEQVRED
jgi:hypothetical protein